MTERKRKKEKLRKAPAPWLPEVLEFLSLDRQAFEEYTPHLSKHQEIEDAYRLVCNHVSHQVLLSLHRLRPRILREVYQKVWRSRWREINRTYMHKLTAYRICDALGYMTERMHKNYEQTIAKGVDGTIDIFGGTFKRDARGKKGKKKKAPGETVIGSIIECLKKGKVTKKQILKVLEKRFPDRNPRSMGNTINVQISSQLRAKYGARLQRQGDQFWIART